MKSETLYGEAIKYKTLRGEVVSLIDEMGDASDLINQCETKREQDLAYAVIMTNWIWENNEAFCKSAWLECYAELLTKRPKKQIQFDNILDKYCEMEVKSNELSEEELELVRVYMNAKP